MASTRGLDQGIYLIDLLLKSPDSLVRIFERCKWLRHLRTLFTINFGAINFGENIFGEISAIHGIATEIRRLKNFGVKNFRLCTSSPKFIVNNLFYSGHRKPNFWKDTLTSSGSAKVEISRRPQPHLSCCPTELPQ